MRERGAIEILEEAIQLLRKAPSATIAVYLAGAVPFFVGLLFFLTDMARNPFAAERLPAESLGVAVLFLWKGVWQAVFQARLYRQLSLSPLQPIRLARLVAIQSTLQPFSLLAIPASLLMTVPFAWTVAFFRNAGLFAALGEPDVIVAARRQAGLWSRQNWLVLSLTSLAGVLLFANALILMMLLPQIGRSFLGIEGDLARLGLRLLNSTTLGVASAITWLAIDPLLDAVYTLRCFYGESLTTGEDLRVALKQVIAAAALALVLVVAMPAARAQTPDRPPAQGDITINPTNTVDAEKLDRAIGEVIRRPEFAWRTPRPAGPEPQGRWAGWMRSALDTVRRGVRWAIERLESWLRGNPDAPREKEGRGGAPPLEIWIGVVAVALVVAAIAAFVAARKTKVVRARPAQSAATPVDVADESVTADQMPESSWLQLADELLAKGDCRLALRALYLGGLNHLSNRDLISIRRWKSGGEYRRELERRARASTDASLLSAFSRNLFLFERGWYGAGAVQRADVEAFATGLEEIRRYAGRA